MKEKNNKIILAALEKCGVKNAKVSGRNESLDKNRSNL